MTVTLVDVANTRRVTTYKLSFSHQSLTRSCDYENAVIKEFHLLLLYMESTTTSIIQLQKKKGSVSIVFSLNSIPP